MLRGLGGSTKKTPVGSPVGAGSVRRPLRMVRFRKLAERAWIRQRLPLLSTHHPYREELESSFQELGKQLRELPSFEDVAAEARFHRAALEKAVEKWGECSRQAQEHAARLSELDPRRRSDGILLEAARQLAQSSQNKGLMSYSPDYLYVFRRTVAGLQITAAPVDEVRAYELLEQLERDETALGQTDTATRVATCRPTVLASGERVRIEVDHEGFWVSIEKASSPKLTYREPFPSYEEALFYVRESLSEDLSAGKPVSADWQRAESASLELLGSPEPTRGSKEAEADKGKSLWSMLMSVPGYRSVFEEGVSDPAEPPKTWCS